MRSRDSFEKVMKKIKKVREPGEPPEEPMDSLEGYICDLCKDTTEKKKIIQCGFCGRWVCKEECWDTEIRACVSCTGLILLATSEKREE
ncbi:MAG: hypothetical protein R6U17_00610 [Thermoplasmata archaeon]